MAPVPVNFFVRTARAAITAAGIFLLCATLVYMVTPHGTAVSPDSIFYFDIAAHLQAGHGLHSTDYSISHYGAAASVPNATWPPLYPALLAALGATPSPASAAILSFVLLAITVCFAQQTLRRFLRPGVALAASLPLAFTSPMLAVHTYAWSEQLFIAVSTALVWAVQGYFTSDANDLRARRTYLGLMCLSLVLAAYTRYIGVIYFALLPGVYFCSAPRTSLRRFFIGSGALSIGAVAALLTRNHLISGSVTGATRAASRDPVIQQLTDFFSALALFFVSAEQLLVVAIIAGLTSILLGIYIWRAPRSTQISADTRSASVTWKLCGAASVYYAFCLIALRSVTAFDDIDLRLISCLAPWLWMGGIAALVHLHEWRDSAVARTLIAALLALMTINGYFTLQDTRRHWQLTGAPDTRSSLRNHYFNYNFRSDANPYRSFFQPLTTPNSVLVIRKPHIHQFATGLTCLQWKADLSAEDIAKLAAMPPRSYIMLEKHDLPSLLARLASHGARPTPVIAGNNVLIPLPLSLETERRISVN